MGLLLADRLVAVGSPTLIQVLVSLCCPAAITVTLAYSVLLAVLLFLGLRWYGALRVDQATELAGIDHIDHGGPAYPEFNMYSEWRLDSEGRLADHSN
jgi:ammonia channel protein AmtB